jgi:superfamily II DNA or RNA helicase
VERGQGGPRALKIEDVRDTLRSDNGVVVVEAPAGCGKTHQAADAAVDLAATINAGQEVLLLAHTNAAVPNDVAGAPQHRFARLRWMPSW